jgi:hypothetical protein
MWLVKTSNSSLRSSGGRDNGYVWLGSGWISDITTSSEDRCVGEDRDAERRLCGVCLCKVRITEVINNCSFDEGTDMVVVC